MSANDPLISVVIPAYNAAAYIGPTLDTVFAQTFTNFEVIVVNDGSPDTAALESTLAPYRSRIRYIRQENRGPSGARNVAIKDARGSYIAFLDSDDVWLPRHLERQVAMLEADSSLGLVYSNAVHIEDGRAVGVAFDNTPQSLPVNFDALLEERATVNTSSAVALRRAILEAGLFDEQMRRCEDFDLWLRMAYSGVRVTFSREIQIGHRLANGLAASGDLMKQALIQVYEKTAATKALSLKQQAIVREKIRTISTAMQFERAKQHLLEGSFAKSLECLELARASARSWKLRAAELGIRSFPRILQTADRSHLRGVERRKRARRARSLARAGISGGSIPGFNIPADRPAAL
jgi:glycosyltransferase involved in cell wall biosynthesis